MQILGTNGVLVLLSGTGGNAEMTVPIDRINRSLLGGNKVVVGCVNSAKEDFELRRGRPHPLGRALARSRRPPHHPPPARPCSDYARILEKPEGDIKTVIEVG